MFGVIRHQTNMIVAFNQLLFQRDHTLQYQETGEQQDD